MPLTTKALVDKDLKNKVNSAKNLIAKKKLMKTAMVFAEDKDGNKVRTKRSETILGHKHGDSAGDMWNAKQHQFSKAENYKYNTNIERFHGLEKKKASSASGSKEARYEHPSPAYGSHRTHFSTDDPIFNKIKKKTPFYSYSVFKKVGEKHPTNIDITKTNWSYSEGGDKGVPVTYRAKAINIFKRKQPQKQVVKRPSAGKSSKKKQKLK